MTKLGFCRTNDVNSGAVHLQRDRIGSGLCHDRIQQKACTPCPRQDAVAPPGPAMQKGCRRLRAGQSP